VSLDYLRLIRTPKPSDRIQTEFDPVAILGWKSKEGIWGIENYMKLEVISNELIH